MAAFKWLIEAPGQQYLTARKIGNMHVFKWTKDHLEAIRFMNEEQADLVMMAIRALDPELFGFARTLGDAKPVQHGWLHNTEEAEPAPKRPERVIIHNADCELRGGGPCYCDQPI